LKDSSTYRLSDRWRRFDTLDFKAQDIPLRRREADEDLERDEKGMWRRKQEGKTQVAISTLEQGFKTST